MSLEAFVSAYIECALWSSTDDDDVPLDRLDASFAPDTLWRMRNDCKAFLAANVTHILEASGREVDPFILAGHDFWLTRNGHGAGFWDGDWPEPQASALTNAAKAFGEFHLYIGDDGRIYGE